MKSVNLATQASKLVTSQLWYLLFYRYNWLLYYCTKSPYSIRVIICLYCRPYYWYLIFHYLTLQHVTCTCICFPLDCAVNVERQSHQIPLICVLRVYEPRWISLKEYPNRVLYSSAEIVKGLWCSLGHAHCVSQAICDVSQ